MPQCKSHWVILGAVATTSLLSCLSTTQAPASVVAAPNRDSDIGCYELTWFSGAYPHRAPLSFRLLPDTWGEVGISPAWDWATKHAKDFARDHVAVTRQMTFDNGCRFISWRPEDDAHAELVIREGSCCGMTLSLTRTAEGLDAHIDQFGDVVRPEPLPPVGDAVYRKIACKDPEWYPPAWMAGDLCVQPAGR